MSERTIAFGEKSIGILDRFIFWLRARQLTRHIPSPCPLAVELGSGYKGDLLRSLLREGKITRAHGIDLSVAPSGLVPGLTLEEGNLNDARVSLPDASAPLVLSLAVLEHLSSPKHLVEEAYRLLVPGGTCVLTTPSPLAKPILELMAYHLHIIDEHEIRDHKHYFTKSELKQLFLAQGFRNISVRHFLFGLNTIVIATK